MVTTYAKTTDSGNQWLGRVPAHWAISPLGSHFDERSEIVSDEDFPPLSVTKAGVVPQMANAAKTDNGASRKLIRAGDFAINSRSDRKGSAGVSSMDGCTSIVYTILTPRPSIDGRFVHHLLRSQAFQEEYYRWGNGIVSDLWSTRYSSMKRIPLAVPPIGEQRGIADYLDRETARIDTLIEEQQRLIDLLRERRRASIEQAVSVVASNGARLKHLVQSVRQGWSPQCYAWPADGIDTWAILKAGAANGGRFRPMENKELPADAIPRSDTVVKRGDLIISRANTRELVGSAAVVLGGFPRLMLSDKLYAFSLDETQAEPQFVATVLGSRRWRDLIELEATGASYSMLNISQSEIVNLPMPLPSVTEQRRIIKQLTEETARIDELIIESERFIELSKERRAALITAAVTGQIDVREGA